MRLELSGEEPRPSSEVSLLASETICEISKKSIVFSNEFVTKMPGNHISSKWLLILFHLLKKHPTSCCKECTRFSVPERGCKDQIWDVTKTINALKEKCHLRPDGPGKDDVLIISVNDIHCLACEPGQLWLVRAQGGEHFGHNSTKLD